MTSYRSNSSFDESEHDVVILGHSPNVATQSSTRPRRERLTLSFKKSDCFRSRNKQVSNIPEEKRVRRREQERRRQVRLLEKSSSRPTRHREQEYSDLVQSREESYSLPPGRRHPRTRLMTEQHQAEGFTPLPPIIRNPSPFDSDSDRGYDVEDRAPKRKLSKSYRKKPNHKRKDSKLERQPEFIEVPSSPRRIRDSDAERARRRQAEGDAARAIRVARQHAEVAYQEHKRREEVEDLGRSFARAYVDERDVRLRAVRDAQEAKVRADELAQQLEKEQRERKYLERQAELLAREKRLEKETESSARVRPILRPVDVHQDASPFRIGDLGSDAIRRAQEDARRRQQHMRDDDSLFGHQREQRRERRGSPIIFDDDFARRGHRRD